MFVVLIVVVRVRDWSRRRLVIWVSDGERLPRFGGGGRVRGGGGVYDGPQRRVVEIFVVDRVGDR